jgi:hypothetical protein
MDIQKFPSWRQEGRPQQNIPFDNTPGLDTNGFLMFETASAIVRRSLPFWDEPLMGIEPGNARLSPWDVVYIAGQALPGISRVTGKRGKRYDLKKVKGTDFAKLTKQGYEPAEIRITEQIWTPQQLHALELIMPMLEAPPLVSKDGTQLALEIRYPTLDLRGLNSVVIKEISLLHPSSIKGVWEQDITCLEYKPDTGKRDATATVDGSGYNVKTITNQMVSKPKFRPTSPMTNTGPNGGRGG